MMLTVDLPWPNRGLHPNARLHWGAKAQLVKAARVDAFYLTRAIMPTTIKADRIKLDVTFNPPNNRRRDLDGMIASLKSAQDGISDALGVDDRFFEPTYRMGPVSKGGKVTVTIMEGEK